MLLKVAMRSRRRRYENASRKYALAGTPDLNHRMRLPSCKYGRCNDRLRITEGTAELKEALAANQRKLKSGSGHVSF